MKAGKYLKKGIVHFLSILMILSAFSVGIITFGSGDAQEAYAADLSSMSAGDTLILKSGTWTGTYVVLNPTKTNSGATGTFVITKTPTTQNKFGSNNTWEGSTQQTLCLYNCYNNLPDAVKEKVIGVKTSETTSEDTKLGICNIDGTVSGKDKAFLLSCNEYIEYKNALTGTFSNDWWLRSPSSNARLTAFAGYVKASDGNAAVQNASNDTTYCRPAFNIDLTSYECVSYDSASKTWTINADGHSYGDWEKKDDNEHQKTCSVCGDVIKEAHTAGEAKYTWYSENTKCLGAVRCTICNDVIANENADTTSVVTKTATCTEKGLTTYTANFTSSNLTTQTKQVETETLGHDWDEATYEWNSNHSACTGTRVCKRDGNHKETASAENVQSSEKLATCEAAGFHIYVATFASGSPFDTQTKKVDIPPLGHDWDAPTYEWAADNSSVTAKRVCKNDATHIETETVNTISSVSKPATCSAKGETTYTATFNDDRFETQTNKVDNIEIDPDAHDWESWSKLDGSQHQRICKHNAAHVEKENHSWDAGSITQQATEDAEGIKTFTCTKCGETKTEALPKKEKKEETKPESKPAAETKKPAADEKTEAKPKTEKKAATKASVSKPKSILVARAVASGKKSAKVTWNKVSGADRYVIYFGICNGRDNYKVAKKISAGTTTWTKKGLSRNSSYKFKVVGQKKVNGKYKTIATSKSAHMLTGNLRGRYTNPKSISVRKTGVVLKKGKTAAIKADIKKVRSNKRLLTSHASLYRYTSNNPKVATVSDNGKITAKGKGNCVIYVQTINGMWKTVKVTVK